MKTLQDAANGEWSQAQIIAAARVLADRSANACNVDREDNWKFYSDDFIADAIAVLSAVSEVSK